MTAPTPLIAGNWKMNGDAAALAEARATAAGLGATRARVAICPPATLVSRAAEALKGTAVAVGGQDCRAEASGAYTGDTAFIGLRTCHEAQRSDQRKNYFFHGLRSLAQWALKVTRSGTRLKVPSRLHHGMARKKPK